ncbi:MAG: glycerol-3-phosphate responsive antiterminator [Lachnospiraceae bacterium]|nr:glycerol-3-phosphate responsive antiterminator [Lachnospiraceae bacterium]MBQ2577646.1 glycerol-3-phosphate responsive antiterminator [Lachnospiraceae bacterium]MBQ5485526.1 glycerol-3-phosphate responsive antiterminator [Lachnospiraceae bacterium]MCR4731729.1 glycerol-3-phosphate responsive antiterminator [Lachnospiraceae bacterium]MEE3354946.1 glycerol-3-phosphate responsive antiterminator [Candidatus Weimeria sp.]
MNPLFHDALTASPVIAAIKDPEGLIKCKDCDSRIIFILYGDILTLPDIVGTVKSYGKYAFVDLDLIDGLYPGEVAVDYLKKSTKADGIISTRSSMITRAKCLGLTTVMRFFVIDSMAYASMEKAAKDIGPDMIEMLPGPMPKIAKKILSFSKVPVIASGLISDREDVYALLDAGVTSVSSTNQLVWFI